MTFPGTPVFYDTLAAFVGGRRRLERLVDDVVALHEPGAHDECPTCRTTAPCPTLRLVTGELTLDQAMAAVRGDDEIDLVAAEADVTRPSVPSLAELLAEPQPAVDRAFEALLGDPPAPPRRWRTA